MKLNKNNLKNIYDTISSLFSLNFIVMYNNENEITRLSNIELPDCVKEDEMKMINTISEKISLRSTNTVCYFESKMKLKYMSFSVCSDENYEGSIIIGPYINYPTQLEVVDSSGRNLDKVIPIIKILQEKAIENIVISMINYQIEDTKVIIMQEDMKIKDTNKNRYIKEFDLSLINIRERYKLENQLLHYVSMGDINKASKIIGKDLVVDLNRFPDEPMRNLKNFAITMNTLLRKAVQENNIEPYVLDSISDYFAKRIENSNKMSIIYSIFEEMMKEYCNLVNEYKTKGYSKLVSNAINYVKLNFKYEIGLSSIADELFVHPTYLAKKFKEETDKTISEYINEIRVKEAKMMLKTTEFKIEDIAYYVGYNDKKYFSKVFKKIYNQSPSDYRKYN